MSFIQWVPQVIHGVLEIDIFKYDNSKDEYLMEGSKKTKGLFYDSLCSQKRADANFPQRNFAIQSRKINLERKKTVFGIFDVKKHDKVH